MSSYMYSNDPAVDPDQVGPLLAAVHRVAQRLEHALPIEHLHVADDWALLGVLGAGGEPRHQAALEAAWWTVIQQLDWRSAGVAVEFPRTTRSALTRSALTRALPCSAVAEESVLDLLVEVMAASARGRLTELEPPRTFQDYLEEEYSCERGGR